MSLTIFILTHIFIGLAAAFTAVGLWRRESGWAPFWFISRAGIGALCLLAGGAALVAGGHYRLSNLTPGEMHIVSALSVRLVVYLETCVVLIGVGAALRAFARADGHRAVAGKGVLLWSVVAALIVTLAEPYGAYLMRRALFAELQPVQLENCEMERFGAERDGGYLLCGNLLDGAEVAYSYGIGGRDLWGCDISRKYEVTVHQYDCFETTRPPACPGGAFSFHAECIGDKKEIIERREFDSMINQIVKNGDSEARLVSKMDIEAAEWEALWSTPDSVLENIDQLTIEFHGVGKLKYFRVVRKLEKHFVVANLHFNNFRCMGGIEPFPSSVYEVLFVNKRIAKLDTSGAKPVVPHTLDVPNLVGAPDCQR